VRFKSCDEWWASLSPVRKMMIHRHFYDAQEPSQDYLEDVKVGIAQSHEFMAIDRGIVCGTPEIEARLAAEVNAARYEELP